MTTVEETVARLEELAQQQATQLAQQAAQLERQETQLTGSARLEAIVEQQAAALAALQIQAGDPELLALRRRGNEAALDAPLTSFPEGARPMDFRPAKVRNREKAIAKLKVLSRARGGVWDPDPRIPHLYGHRAGDDLTGACEYLGLEGFEKTCQRTCWTPETETRFLYALGLRDLATRTLVPLTPPDPKNNPDLIKELIGLLKPGAATAADVSGTYPDRNPTREEVGTARAVTSTRKVAAA